MIDGSAPVVATLWGMESIGEPIISALVSALLAINAMVLTFLVARIVKLDASLHESDKATNQKIDQLTRALAHHEKHVAQHFATKPDLADRVDSSIKPILQSLNRVETMLTASLMPRMNHLEQTQARQDAEMHSHQGKER